MLHAGHGDGAQGGDRARSCCRTPSGSCASCARSSPHIDVTDCLFRCNHASNYLPIGGRLPGDKAAILAALDKVLEAPAATQLRPESWRLL